MMQPDDIAESISLQLAEKERVDLDQLGRAQTGGPMTGRQFREITGQQPDHDDLERVNCERAGTILHETCGWCPTHDQPAWWCLC